MDRPKCRSFSPFWPTILLHSFFSGREGRERGGGGRSSRGIEGEVWTS